MYVENKTELAQGEARIGRVYFSKTGATLRYGGRSFQSLNGRGFKSNYFDVETGEEFWISGPRRDGHDRLYGGSFGVEIDADVAHEYWRSIRARALDFARGERLPASGFAPDPRARAPRLRSG
jgi:hypothetical protein